MFGMTGGTAQSVHHRNGFADRFGIKGLHTAVSQQDFDLSDAGSGLAEKDGKSAITGKSPQITQNAAHISPAAVLFGQFAEVIDFQQCGRHHAGAAEFAQTCHTGGAGQASFVLADDFAHLHPDLAEFIAALVTGHFACLLQSSAVRGTIHRRCAADGQQKHPKSFHFFSPHFLIMFPKLFWNILSSPKHLFSRFLKIKQMFSKIITKT
jgi:hypothetical protein